MATTNKYLKGDLPIAISVNIPTALVRYQREDFAASYAIGNTPWLSAASDNNKISRITTTYQKERIDQSATAGEQSLSNWWLRSATSWHHGAGERFYDAESSDLFRFYESNNVDPWTLGELSLLPATTQLSTAGASNPVTVSGGTFYLEGSTLKFYNSSTNTSTSFTLPSSAVAQKITTDGSDAIVGADLGIYRVTPGGTITKLYNQSAHNPSGWTVQAINYVKERIVVGVRCVDHMGLYELTPTPTSPPNTPGAGQEIYETSNMNLTRTGLTSNTRSVRMDKQSPHAKQLNPLNGFQVRKAATCQASSPGFPSFVETSPEASFSIPLKPLFNRPAPVATVISIKLLPIVLSPPPHGPVVSTGHYKPPRPS